jgi:hypothetical protein
MHGTTTTTKKKQKYILNYYQNPQHMQTAAEGPYADYDHVVFHGDGDSYCGTV